MHELEVLQLPKLKSNVMLVYAGEEKPIHLLVCVCIGSHQLAMMLVFRSCRGCVCM